MTMVFVYGTLKSGERNHNILKDSPCLGKFTTSPEYRLYTNGNYPCMVKDDKNGLPIEGEIYEVTQEVLKKLDWLEGVAFGLYERTYIDVSGYPGTVHGYLFLRDTSKMQLLEHYWDGNKQNDTFKALWEHK